MAALVEPAEEIRERTLRVDGMDCASCVAHVEKAIKKLPGIQHVAVNLALGRAQVKFDPAAVDEEQIAAEVTGAGYPAHVARADASPKEQDDAHEAHARRWLFRGVLGMVLWAPVEALHWIVKLTSDHPHAGIAWMDWVGLVTSTLAIVLIGGAFYRSALKAALRRTSNMDTLIAMGASVAYGYSLVALVGYLLHWWQTLPALYFTEGTALLALISIGHWMEARARTRAGSAIRDLMHLAPATAWKVEPTVDRPKSMANAKSVSLSVLSTIDAQTSIPPGPQEVPVSSLQINDHVLVRPGDRVPIDGIVVSGTSSVDESMLTGEAVPVTRTKGDKAFGGTINQDGALTIRVTNVGDDTALAQIVKLVETAQNSKPPVQKLADQIAAVFVPSVLVIALLTAIGWYAHGAITGVDAPTMWANIAKAVCSVLIIACPCALGLAVPAALMVGTGRGAKLGILYRDINALQSAERLEVVVLDKTGTLTRGRPIVQRVIASDHSTEADVLMLAASAEQFSSHPLAKAIVTAAQARGLSLRDPDDFKNEPGTGVRATIDGRRVFVGRAPAAEAGPDAHATRVSVIRDDVLVGTLELVDEIKPDSSAAIAALHAMGLRTVLLTGDHAAAARAIASEAGIDDVRADVKPAGKAEAIRDLQQSPCANRRSSIAMVGDGINDAPALAQADLGIAIGSGADIAKETGGIVLVSGSLTGVPQAIRLSRATMRVIRQNLFFAFFYNVIAIPLAAMGLLSPILCAAAMALSDLTVIGNALRLKRTRL